MTPERWQQIDRLLDEVELIPEGDQKAFLAEQCGTDEDLQQEVLSLLKEQKNVENFIEDSAIRIIGKNLASENRSTLNDSYLGKSVNSYKIEKLIGKGGMGEVYLAFDEKLKRQIALKFLPGAIVANDERVLRFEREASAISQLNHPNIVTIFDVGVFENSNFIATEYVEGETLRDHAQNGMSLKEALEVVIQCCDALSAAHHAGIIHRDIKPENIIVRPDGYVKILDFGLAKLMEEPSFDSRDSHKTSKGMIIGTPAYMSPEQISDERVDQRTDLWSIAVVLYELVTGLNPFKKETKPKTFESILSENTPAASFINPKVPFELDQILAKALEKDADISYQSAADFRADLIRVKRDLDSSISQSRGTRKSFYPINAFRISKATVIIAGLVCVLLFGAFALYFYTSKKSQSNAVDWTNAINTPLTNQPGTEYFPSLAPDGEYFVFAAKPKDNYDIFLKRIGGTKEINLTEDSDKNDTQPAFSPDGKLIAFRSERDEGGIFVMEKTGENLRRICDFGFHPSWSPDGKQITVSDAGFERPSVRGRSSIWIVNLDTGEKRKLVKEHAYQPAWSPNGKRIAFWMIGNKKSKRDVATVSADGGELQIIPNLASTNWNPVWSPDGKFLYYSSSKSGNMAIWRVRIDESTGKTLGDSEVVPTPGKFNAHLSFSKDGNRLVYVQINDQSNLKTVDFDPDLGKPKGVPVWITSGEQEIHRPRLSPDKKQFVVDVAGLTQDDLVAFDRDGTNRRELTNDEYFDRYPNWSADGKNIAFMSDRGGIHQLWMINPDGSGLRKISKTTELTSFPIWAPEGMRFSCRVGDEHVVIDLSNPKSPTERKLKTIKGMIYHDWDWSPDGTKLLGRWRDDSGIGGIGYYSLETDEYVKLWVGESGFPRWLPDSRRFLLSLQGKVNIFDMDAMEMKKMPSLEEDHVGAVGISRDGSLMYFTVNLDDSSIWLLDARND